MQCSVTYLVLFVPADRWRVILKAEHPDYIHANFVNVSTCVETNSLLNRLPAATLTIVSVTQYL